MVGNGAPLSSYGSCSVTAGRPNGHRAATRRKARGRLPIWRSTMSRSSTRDTVAWTPSLRCQATLWRSGGMPALPGADALDDEEPLARLDVADPAGPRGRVQRRSLSERAVARGVPSRPGARPPAPGGCRARCASRRSSRGDGSRGTPSRSGSRRGSGGEAAVVAAEVLSSMRVPPPLLRARRRSASSCPSARVSSAGPRARPLQDRAKRAENSA